MNGDSTPAGRQGWLQMLDQLGVRPSRALGQNFLHDVGIVRRIADAAEIESGSLVVEIGPGLGILTNELAQRAGSVIAIELDRRLAGHLATHAPANVRIVEQDILRTDLSALVSGRPYLVVANLPYSVAAAAIEHLLESQQPPERMIIMVQREVAERIVARPPQMSVLAVAVQFLTRPRNVFRIGPGAFIPAPKVDSAVLRLDVRPAPPLAGVERAAFFRLVRAGFGQRRKQIGNALAAGLGLPREILVDALMSAGIEPSRRAETLTVDEWLRLFFALESESSP
jgi:16S rRNA (adenine1518-N6/adenine1519-N6)-dimethyltransferase